jgi:hypothetical protein
MQLLKPALVLTNPIRPLSSKPRNAGIIELFDPRKRSIGDNVVQITAT